MNYKKIFLTVFSLLLIFGFIAYSNVLEMAGSTTTEASAENEPLQEVDFNEITKAAAQFLESKQESIIMSPKEVFEKLVLNPDPNYYVIDLRDMEHFIQGSIVGAVNIPYGVSWQPEQIVKLPDDKKIILVCYSGHTASQTAAFWGMLGYDVAVLEDGMRGWLTNPDIIGTSPLACDPADFPVTTEPVVNVSTYDLPEINKEFQSLTELLVAQNEKFFTSGASSVIGTKTVLEDVIPALNDSFFILDIRKNEHYQAGYIQGAVNIPLDELIVLSNLQKIPTDKRVVVVCYTGHEAAIAARILNQLSYNAVPMLNGMSAWTYDEAIIGTEPINCTKVANLPTIVTRVEAEAAGAG